MPYPFDLESVQWAREATPGTDLATTSKMIVENFQLTPGSPEAYRPKLARGLMLANRGGESVIQRSSLWSAEGPLSFEQAQNLFSGVILNDAAPTSGPPKVWNHVRSPAAMPSLATYTFERSITDGSTPIGQAVHYAMMSDLELTFARNEVWRYKANGFARRIQTETLTAAIALPTYETCLVPGTKVFIDTSWAGLGGTQITGQVLSGSVKFGSGAAPFWTTEGRSDLDWLQPVYSSERTTCECSLTLLVGAQYATEKTAAEAQSLRAVRLQIDGASANAQIQIDMLLKYKVPELFAFELDDEQFIVTLDMVGSTDGTNAWQATVTNLVATYA